MGLCNIIIIIIIIIIIMTKVPMNPCLLFHLILGLLDFPQRMQHVSF